MSASDSMDKKTDKIVAAPKAKPAKSDKADKADKGDKAAKSAKPSKSVKPAPKPAAKPAPKPAVASADAAGQPVAVMADGSGGAASVSDVAVADVAVAAPKIVTTSMPVVAGPEWKKRDLVDKVVKRSGVKKKDAKLVVDAMLAVMGEALAEGRELILQPMGRIKTTRIKDSGNGRVLICKLRQGGGEGKDGKDPLAEDDD